MNENKFLDEIVLLDSLYREWVIQKRHGFEIYTIKLTCSTESIAANFHDIFDALQWMAMYGCFDNDLNSWARISIKKGKQNAKKTL